MARNRDRMQRRGRASGNCLAVPIYESAAQRNEGRGEFALESLMAGDSRRKLSAFEREASVSGISTTFGYF